MRGEEAPEQRDLQPVEPVEERAEQAVQAPRSRVRPPLHPRRDGDLEVTCAGDRVLQQGGLTDPRHTAQHRPELVACTYQC